MADKLKSTVPDTPELSSDLYELPLRQDMVLDSMYKRIDLVQNLR